MDQCSPFLITGPYFRKLQGYRFKISPPTLRGLWPPPTPIRPIHLTDCFGCFTCSGPSALRPTWVASRVPLLLHSRVRLLLSSPDIFFMYSVDFLMVSSHHLDQWSPFHTPVNILGWAPLLGPPVGLCVYIANTSFNTSTFLILRVAALDGSVLPPITWHSVM